MTKAALVMACSIVVVLLVTTVPSSQGNSRVRRIIFGEQATEGKHPWMVQLMSGRSHHCGATLINRCYVLTAAHCLQAPGVADRMALGDYDVWSVSATKKEVFFQDSRTNRWKILPHPGASTKHVNGADIGVIRLPKCVDYVKDLIEPIALASKKAKTGCPTTSYGWGENEYFLSQRRLRKSKQTPVYQNKCLSPNSGGWCHIYIRPDNEYNGDSGGPLIGNGANGEDCQIGTVESTLWGVDSRYMDVSHFVPWIQDIIKENPCECGDSSVTTCEVAFCNCGPDVIFAIDQGNKISQTKINNVKTMMKNIASSLNGLTDDGALFGALTFDTAVQKGFYLGDKTAETVEDAIDALTITPRAKAVVPNLANALTSIKNSYFNKNGDRKNHANIVVVVTSSKTFSPTAAAIAQSLANDDIAIFVVHIGNNQKLGQLLAVATNPDNVHLIKAYPSSAVTKDRFADQLSAKLKNTGCPSPHDD